MARARCDDSATRFCLLQRRFLLSVDLALRLRRYRLRRSWGGDTLLYQLGCDVSRQCKVLRQLQTSDLLTRESKVSGSAWFAEIETMARDASEQHIVQEIPLEFISARMGTGAQTTMGFMVSNPVDADAYRTLGFDVFWKGITRK